MFFISSCFFPSYFYHLSRFAYTVMDCYALKPASSGSEGWEDFLCDLFIPVGPIVSSCDCSQGLCYHPMLAFLVTVLMHANFWSCMTCLSSLSWVIIFGLSACYDLVSWKCLNLHIWCLCLSNDSSFKLFNPICITHSFLEVSMSCPLCPEGLFWLMLQSSNSPYI